MVTARGCSYVSGEECCGWLRGRAALRNILKGGERHVESFQSRWSTCGARFRAEGNRTTHLTRPPAACLSSILCPATQVVSSRRAAR